MKRINSPVIRRSPRLALKPEIINKNIPRMPMLEGDLIIPPTQIESSLIRPAASTPFREHYVETDTYVEGITPINPATQWSQSSSCIDTRMKHMGDGGSSFVTMEG